MSLATEKKNKGANAQRTLIAISGTISGRVDI
jgi:hypothetical protein